MAFRLSVEDGRFVQSLIVQRPRITAGRAVGNDLRLSSQGVSRRHAMFRQDGETVVVTDLQAKHGLVVNDERLERIVLRPGEAVRLGKAVITLMEVKLGPGQVGATPGGSNGDLRPALAAPAPLDGPAPFPKVLASEGSQGRVARAFGVVSPRAIARVAVSIVLHIGFFWALSTAPLRDGGGEPEREVAFEVDTDVAEVLEEAPEKVETPDPVDTMERPDFDPYDRPIDAGIVAPVDPDLPKTEQAIEEPFEPPSVEVQRVPDRTIALKLRSGPAANLGATFGKDGALQANAHVARSLSGSPAGRVLLRGLRRNANATAIRVVAGDYDQCEKILHGLDLEHGYITSGQLAAARPGPAVRAIFVNCTGKSTRAAAKHNLERWVHAGGYLFTTDWGIEKVIDPGIPGYIRVRRQGDHAVMTEDETVTGRIHGKHPLLRGMPKTEAPPRFWLEDSSLIFDIVDRDKVDVLIESQTLANRYGSGLIAVTFRHGRGRVVHCIGHYFQKEGNLRGAYVTQRLLVNFLAEALKGR